MERAPASVRAAWTLPVKPLSETWAESCVRPRAPSPPLELREPVYDTPHHLEQRSPPKSAIKPAPGSGRCDWPSRSGETHGLPWSRRVSFSERQRDELEAVRRAQLVAESRRDEMGAAAAAAARLAEEEGRTLDELSPRALLARLLCFGEAIAFALDHAIIKCSGKMESDTALGEASGHGKIACPAIKTTPPVGVQV